MTELDQIYSCSVCGNEVKVVHTGFGQLVCCGQDMQLKNETPAEESATEEKTE